MILSKPMKYALELVRMFNGLSENQLSFLLKRKFPNRNPTKDIDRMLRMKLIAKRDNSIYIPKIEIKPDIQEAVEIACHLWNINTISLSNEQHPILLKLVKLFQGKAQAFLVCRAEDISDLGLEYENAKIIVIAYADDIQRTEIIIKSKFNTMNCDFLIAAKEYGKYYFYKIGGKQ